GRRASAACGLSLGPQSVLASINVPIRSTILLMTPDIANASTSDPYAAAAASAARLAELAGQPGHDAAVVLGSGWAQAADALGPVPVVRSVRAGPLRVLVFLGRTHLYEGHPVATVVHGVRTAVAAGCRVIVLTNAAGGIRAG